MKFLFLLSSVILLSCNSKKKNASSPVHFDGLYQSAVETNKATGDKYISYLRFYDDGTVIHVSSSETAEQIKKWFVKGSESISEGHFTTNVNDLSFVSTGFGVSVNYAGKIVNKELLQMHVTSLNHESEEEYSFVRE